MENAASDFEKEVKFVMENSENRQNGLEKQPNEKPRRLFLRDLKELPGSLKMLSPEQCVLLCREIRGILISTVSRTGGHLASNLGTVELSMAIHRVFDSPADKILWDVGHQSYTHKLLTGRLPQFSTLRQENGLSGYPRPSESPHDPAVMGHSSNSISVACGIAQGMRLKGDPHSVVAVIGDGALTGGLAYEGLNNAGKSGDPIVIVLNHNDMSISKNVGALARYLSRIRSSGEYQNTKNAVERLLNRTPVVGKPLKKVIKTGKSLIKSALYQNSTMFEDFGLAYLGPISGHDQESLEKALTTAKNLRRPVLVHVNTVKGKGFGPAEKNPGAFHGLAKMEMRTGNPEIISEDSFSAVFGKTLAAMACVDDRICAVTAAMKYGTGLQYFASAHRNRFYDVGIAEQHAVAFCAGLAQQGRIPVAAVYSSFLQRAYDQILHDCAISGLHVIFGVDRAGFVGEDGETHQGLFDVSYLTGIPGAVIYAPADYEELQTCMQRAIYQEKGVVALRYPRGGETRKEKITAPTLSPVYTKNHTAAWYYGAQAEGFSEGGSKPAALFISYGRISWEMLFAQADLAAEGVLVDCLKLTRIFPLPFDDFSLENSAADTDTDALSPEKRETVALDNIRQYPFIFFFEEGVRQGGIGQCLSAMLLEKGYRGQMHIIAADSFVSQASVLSQLRRYGLDREGMAGQMRRVVFGGTFKQEEPS